MLVSWVRLMDGRFRDPLVGRDLLIGALFGAGIGLVWSVTEWIPEAVGIRTYGFLAGFWSWESLRGLPQAAAALAGVHAGALQLVLNFIMMFLILRLLLRRTWIAVIAFSALVTLISSPGTGHPVPYLIGFLIILAVIWFVLFRFGLLPYLLGFTVFPLLRFLPLTFDLTAWYGYVTLLVLFVTVGAAAWGFWTALAGRPLFHDGILEVEARM